MINKDMIPPIKIQGIKTKILKHIKENINWDFSGTYYEPFLGSGVVLFNLKPQNAIVSDKNPHIINFYKAIQDKQITSKIAKEFLEYHGDKLDRYGESYYYDIRNEFNTNNNPMYFLFLNRSCFNGVIRFNSKGEFNTPFCKKNNRFSKAYITKICNQIEGVSMIIEGKNWQFINSDWKNIITKPKANDFVYIDPPYIGRDTSYIGKWENSEAVLLADKTKALKCNFIFSMWKSNKYRFNEHIHECWSNYKMVEINHFYHIGSKEALRNEIIEVLILNNKIN